ncbi:hypothetical protein D3C87_1506120 [compost metagenome]
MAKEFTDVRHPVQDADGDQRQVKALLQSGRQVVNVRFDELRRMGRAGRQFPCLPEKCFRLVDAHHAARTQGKQRQTFAAVVAAQLHHVLAVDTCLGQQSGQCVVQAGKIRVFHALQQGLPFAGVFVVTGGVIPGLAVAGDGLFFCRQFHCTLQGPGRRFDRSESRSTSSWQVLRTCNPRSADGCPRWQL